MIHLLSIPYPTILINVNFISLFLSLYTQTELNSVVLKEKRNIVWFLVNSWMKLQLWIISLLIGSDTFLLPESRSIIEHHYRLSLVYIIRLLMQRLTDDCIHDNLTTYTQYSGRTVQQYSSSGRTLQLSRPVHLISVSL